MNETKNYLLERAKVSETALVGTVLENDFDPDVDAPEEPLNVTKKLDEIEVAHKETQALSRSARIRMTAEWLPENAVKSRKAFYCNDKNGYFNKEGVGAANQAGMMNNPDMMGTMMKQNLQGIIHMFMFQGIGQIFQGFILGQVPIPLGIKFKGMLQ